MKPCPLGLLDLASETWSLSRHLMKYTITPISIVLRIQFIIQDGRGRWGGWGGGVKILMRMGGNENLHTSNGP